MQKDISEILNPRFDYKKGSNFINSDDSSLVSNYYPLALNKEYQTIHQYSFEFQPIIPIDSDKLTQKIIGSIKKQLRANIGYICFKGKMMWGNLKRDLALIIKTQIQIKNQKQSYQVCIKPNTIIPIDDFISKSQSNLIKLSQVINVNTKNVLRQNGFKELDQGKFYQDDDFGKDKIFQAGLSVWRGYEVNVIMVANKLFIRADICSRVLRTQSLLQTMDNTGHIKDKDYINIHFKNLPVITRYGKHRIFHIVQIDYTMSPKSKFMDSQNQNQITFLDYYKNNHQIAIRDHNQPLIKIIVKHMNKEQVQYLIPELVVLTGLADQHRSNFKVMQQINKKTKLRVDERVKQTTNIINLLSKQENSADLMYKLETKAQQFPGTIMGAPKITLKQKVINPANGQFQLRSKLLDPIDLKQYYFVYTKYQEKDLDDVDATIDQLMKASKVYGIRLAKPIEICIQGGKNVGYKDWIEQIERENKQGKPQFVILYFNKNQMKDKKLYENLKSTLIHKMHLNSQVITKKTLSADAKGALSKASKILLQINDKMGHPLYKVQRQHPFWGKNTVTMGAIAVSKGVKGFIASIVGTKSNDMTQYFSQYHRVQNRQKIDAAKLQSMISNWIKSYFKQQGRKLPSTVLMYRQGLNEKQAGKVLQQQLKIINDTFESVSSKAKVPAWKPKLIYILVSQKTGTRMYQQDKNKNLSNPLPGTIVGSQMSKDGSYEFLMASATTSEGTCNMVQYKVAFDSSNQQVPHEALKILTYEQCYNYPNWAGSVRFPATLQKANKLAKFVSSFGEDTIDKDNPLKTLDYYI